MKKEIPSMKQEELQNLHSAILIIADEIKRVCDKNGIQYSLIGGSMLGAIRHKGFIPWDDDMDIGMIRSEYERFIDACKSDLGDDFDLQNSETDPNYVYGFSKILLKGTSLIQYGHENTKYRKGIFVDVFPYDYIPNEKRLQKKQSRTNYVLNKMLREKMGVAADASWGIKEKLIFKGIDFIDCFFSTKKLVRMLVSNMTKYAENNSDYMSNMSGFYGYEKETIPVSLFSEMMDVQFEDRTFPICKKYDEFLRLYYNKYMELPPVEKRRTHAFLKLDFGKYKQ